MTRQEVSALAAVVTATYPQFYAKQTAQDIENMIRAWAFTLEDYTYAEASEGLKIFMASDTKGFPPAPGQIIDCIQKARYNPETEMSAAEAWAIVYKASGNVDWFEPEEAWNKLPPMCQRAVGTVDSLVEMAKMDIDKLLVAEKGRFMRQYESIVKQEQEYMRLPLKVRERLALAHKRAMGQIEQKEG